MRPLFALFLLLAPAAKSYDVEVAADAAEVGKPSKIVIKLTPKPGFHVNQEYPTSLEIKPNADVTFAKSKFAKADAKKFGDGEAIFEVPFKASKAGTKELEGVFRFAMCTDKDCFPYREKLSLRADVK